MTVYQIFVDGSDKMYSNHFKCSSKNIYRHYPTEVDINEFVNKCADEINFVTPTLDITKSYNVNIVELNLID